MWPNRNFKATGFIHVVTLAQSPVDRSFPPEVGSALGNDVVAFMISATHLFDTWMCGIAKIKGSKVNTSSHHHFTFFDSNAMWSTEFEH